MTRSKRIERLLTAIPTLSDYRLQLIDRIVSVFSLPRDYWKSKTSGLISERVLEDFGDALRLHHCFSREPFSKDKFEYALESVLKTDEIDAALAPRGQRGYDIRIRDENFSLKTEAAKAIRSDTIHISKFMELGGGQWGDDPSDLIGLRAQFLGALAGIQRILILRALKKGTPEYFYELVEIPKALLKKAATGRLKMMSSSKQSPKPGYCYVEKGEKALYSLYFDGGGERKLQIKGLRKDLCLVHASWKFELPTDAL
ncbi:MAG: restriction endonuclease [Nitrospirae bacterium]|nr:restriction endonuclease [Nitrospirota bacterium]